MCFPGVAAVGSLVLGAASSMASYAGGQANYAAQEYAYNQNYQNSLALGREQDLSLTQRQMQESASFSEKDHMAVIEGAQKQAQVMSAAASNGEAGGVVTSLVNSIGQQIGEKRATLETNYKNTVSNLQSQKQGDVLEEGMRIQSVAPPEDPGIGNSLLNIGGDAVKAAGTTSGQAGLNALGSGLNISM